MDNISKQSGSDSAAAGVNIIAAPCSQRLSSLMDLPRSQRVLVRQLAQQSSVWQKG